jgi:hypothetical protein
MKQFKILSIFPLKNTIEISYNKKILYIKLNKPIHTLSDSELRYEVIRILFG